MEPQLRRKSKDNYVSDSYVASVLNLCFWRIVCFDPVGLTFASCNASKANCWTTVLTCPSSLYNISQSIY